MLFEQLKPYLYVVILQFGNAGLVIIAKAALNHGMMNHYTFATYRNLIATIVMAPFALYFERKGRPKLTLSIFFKIMLLGFLEPVVDQNLYYAGMKYTTATFAIAMCNIIPAMTFLMAWICRLEKVNIKKIRSIGKIVGTLVTVGGAMIMTVVVGPTIGLPWTKGSTTGHQTQSTTPINPGDNIKGSMMIIAGCLSWSCFYIVQALALKSYPAELSLTALICAAGTLQGSIVTVIAERGNTAAWRLHWDAGLVTMVYGGVICSGLGYYLSSIIMKQNGSVFVTAFNSLSMVIVAVLGSFVLSEQLNLGSSSDIPTTRPASVGQLVVPIAENEHDHSITIDQNKQPVMTTTLSIQHSDNNDSSLITEGGETIAVSIGDEDQSIDRRLTDENKKPVMTTTLSIQHSDNDSSLITERGETIAVSIGDEDQSIDLRLPELHGFLDPKGVSYLLRVYPVFMGLVVGKSLWEKHTPFPITNPFVIISIVVYAMAYLNLLILSCIYDGLPRQTFSPVHYKISKYVFYILCFLAPFLLLPLLFIPRD